MPVRDGMKNPSKHSYAVPTAKLERPVPMVHCEGTNERVYVYLLKYDPMVVSFEVQPCTIVYIFNQKKDCILRTLPFTGTINSQALSSANQNLKWQILRICKSGPRHASGASSTTTPS